MTPSTSTPVKVLVVGGGGREHAICWKLAKSAKVAHVYCAPGNGGTAIMEKVSNTPIKVTEFERIAEFSKENQIALVVIGPDNPLADGIVDILTAHGLRVFGPTKAAAKLEWSKSYAKQFMAEQHIPMARYFSTSDHKAALEFARKNDWATVIKADGLALGKGVFVCDSLIEVEAALETIFEKKAFGDAGSTVLLEERLSGPELSLLFFCDGKHLVPMPASQDHKRRFDGDSGPNTGGMGVYAPVALFDLCADQIAKTIVKPFEDALASGAIKYQGILYAGLMVCAENKPYVLEFNARFGDPETQALLPMLKSDLFEILCACTDGTLDRMLIEWSDQASCCVVAAGKDYPNSSSRGEAITVAELPPGCTLFHAGTKLGDSGLVTDGGRVLAITAMAPNMEAARDLAYRAIRQVTFAGMDYRKDIARRAVEQCLSS
jgi:phosphoribosylamine--glycine ligase